jgi:glutamyl-tRNA synthetase
VIETLQARSKTLEDMAESALFYFADAIDYEEKAAKKFLKPAVLEAMHFLLAQFETLESFSEENLETAFKAVMDQTGLKLGKIAQPVRVALTGRTASPGIFEVTAILGKDKVISRLQKAIRFIKASRKLSVLLRPGLNKRFQVSATGFKGSRFSVQGCFNPEPLNPEPSTLNLM